MHNNVIASHDRGRLRRRIPSDNYVPMDDVYVDLGDGFCIISLRDDYGISFAWSESHLTTLRGYGFFIEATVEETLTFGLEVA